MNAFICEVCGQLLFFDNSSCLQCGSLLGFDPATLRLRALTADAGVLRPVDGDASSYRYCGNHIAARCNWLVPSEDPSALCASCRLTTVRPNDAEADAMAAFADAESAKRRLIFQLRDLGLPVVGSEEDPMNGVGFELLSSRGRDVTTGHEDGVITLDLSEVVLTLKAAGVDVEIKV